MLSFFTEIAKTLSPFSVNAAFALIVVGLVLYLAFYFGYRILKIFKEFDSAYPVSDAQTVAKADPSLFKMVQQLYEQMLSMRDSYAGKYATKDDLHNQRKEFRSELNDLRDAKGSLLSEVEHIKKDIGEMKEDVRDIRQEIRIK